MLQINLDARSHITIVTNHATTTTEAQQKTKATVTSHRRTTFKTNNSVQINTKTNAVFMTRDICTALMKTIEKPTNATTTEKAAKTTNVLPYPRKSENRKNKTRTSPLPNAWMISRKDLSRP